MDALTKAAEARRSAGLKMNNPAPVYDLAEASGLQVRFMRTPGLDGLYSKEKKLVLLSSLRPSGRQTFSCAHELGHHIYGHGSSVLLPEDVVGQVGRKNDTAEEYLVNRFASFLLMPKVAVKNGFVRRGWKLENVTPEQMFTVAGWLGVGYTTLIYHMTATLKLITREQSVRLLKIQPRNIRKSILGSDLPQNLFVVDAFWSGRPVDIQMGDAVRVPDSIDIEGGVIEIFKSDKGHKTIFGLRPGIGKLSDSESDWSAFLRVARREYEGLNTYRHLDDPEED